MGTDLHSDTLLHSQHLPFTQFVLQCLCCGIRPDWLAVSHDILNWVVGSPYPVFGSLVVLPRPLLVSTVWRCSDQVQSNHLVTSPASGFNVMTD